MACYRSCVMKKSRLHKAHASGAVGVNMVAHITLQHGFDQQGFRHRFTKTRQQPQRIHRPRSLSLSLSLSPSLKHISAEHGDHVDLEITRESIEDFFGRFLSKLARDRMADLIPPCPSGTVAFCEKKTSANWSSFKRFLQTEETCDDFDKFRRSTMERLLISGPCGCQRK